VFYFWFQTENIYCEIIFEQCYILVYIREKLKLNIGGMMFQIFGCKNEINTNFAIFLEVANIG